MALYAGGRITQGKTFAEAYKAHISKRAESDVSEKRMRDMKISNYEAGGGAYNAVRQSDGSPAVESRASGADIYMKCVGWKCRLRPILVLGIVLLAVVPLFAQQSPTP